MRVWAIVMKSPQQEVICCLLADSQAEAFAGAFAYLVKQKDLADNIHSYAPKLYTYVDIPVPNAVLNDQKLNSSSSFGTSFDDQIKQANL